MKIAIPVDDKSDQTKVCISFGRAPYFLIYDTGKQETLFVENSGANSQGGAGIKAAQVVVDHQVEALLTPRCGENAAEVLKTAGIKMYKTTGNSVQENIRSLEQGILSLLQEIHPGLHGHGGK